jgi:hyaluronoglucosaminidase
VSGLAIRGVVEGFYGRPWTVEQRHDMVAFIAELGMNAYVYSPKDDPYTRRRWREPYPDAEAAELRELAAVAREAGVALWYGVSPGLSMRYSEPADVEAVHAKLAGVRALGATDAALFLDDIPGRLQHPGDAAAFPDLVAAQLHLVRRVEQRLAAEAADARFAVCPTDYWGHGDEPYITALGSGLAGGTALFWTGRAICSPELTTPEAELFARSTGRRPLYWDNFPVNDVAMTHELHIGPYLGRDPGLAGTAAGIVANPMPLAEASKIGIASVADFCRDPHAFDPEASWEAALRRVAGPRDAEPFREFADAVRGSALCTDDAPRLAARLERFAFDYQFGAPADAVGDLRLHLAHLSGVAERMGRLENRALAREIAPWVAQYARGVEAVDAAVAALAPHTAGEPPQLHGSARDAVAARLDGLRAARLRVFGDLVDMFLSDLIGEFSAR